MIVREPTAARLINLERARERIWGFKSIADFAGVSERTARRWARMPGSPIYRVQGRYFAMRTELDRWMRGN